eukprot:5340706-Amphidinium_carterae.1
MTERKMGDGSDCFPSVRFKQTAWHGKKGLLTVKFEDRSGEDAKQTCCFEGRTKHENCIEGPTAVLQEQDECSRHTKHRTSFKIAYETPHYTELVWGRKEDKRLKPAKQQDGYIKP